MTTIWKFPLTVVDEQSVKMPAGARILCVQMQGGLPCLWAEVNTSAPMRARSIVIHGTGNPMPAESECVRSYIGTFQSGPFVWHAYEYSI
jgi:hypothetical protein